MTCADDKQDDRSTLTPEWPLVVTRRRPFWHGSGTPPLMSPFASAGAVTHRELRIVGGRLLSHDEYAFPPDVQIFGGWVICSLVATDTVRTGRTAMRDRSVIWIATITASAGFLGAVVGGGVTYLTNEQNIESESDETIRSERTEAYHSFLAAAEDIAAYIDPLPETPTEAQESHVVELSSRFNNQFALVLVIAPDDTKEAAIEVVDLVARTIDTGVPPENFRDSLIEFAQAADDDLGRE